jgi:hypothetical protein
VVEKRSKRGEATGSTTIQFMSNGRRQSSPMVFIDLLEHFLGGYQILRRIVSTTNADLGRERMTVSLCLYRSSLLCFFFRLSFL